MMYGFGDVSQPRSDTVDAMEDLAIDFIQELCQDATDISNVQALALAVHQASSQAQQQNQQENAASTSRVKIDDVLFALRHDPVKQARAEELLQRYDELQKARKAFDATATGADDD